jgi:hypothetical protein
LEEAGGKSGKKRGKNVSFHKHPEKWLQLVNMKK